jgi:hypothetical protein
MDLTLHVYHHFDSGSVDQKLEQLLTRMGEIMTVVTDLQAKYAQLQADLTAETNLDKAVVLLIQADAATIADLRAQLAAAIAAGGNTADLQAVVDGMEAVHTSMLANATTTGAAVVSGTGA